MRHTRHSCNSEPRQLLRKRAMDIGAHHTSMPRRSLYHADGVISIYDYDITLPHILYSRHHLNADLSEIWRNIMYQ